MKIIGHIDWHIRLCVLVALQVFLTAAGVTPVSGFAHLLFRFFCCGRSLLLAAEPPGTVVLACEGMLGMAVGVCAFW